MPLEHLWATWRSSYVTGAVDGSPSATGSATGGAEDAPGSTDGSLFERILGAEGTDLDKHIVVRGRTCFVLLNRFPYTSGHLMVLPNRAVADLDALTADEHDELWALVRDAVVALRRALDCDGVNVGLNLGRAAGGSQSDHLHVHCVPRWTGDANFMSVAADTRVLPVSLDEVHERLVASWPTPTERHTLAT